MQTYPGPTGLYDPRFEHDSCGVSFVAHMKGHASNELVQTGLLALTNLEHRGATGAEPDTGDGAGILIQIPDRLLRDTVEFDLPPAGAYAAGIAFLPAADDVRVKVMARIEQIFDEVEWDFEQIPTDLFAPAQLTVDVVDGPTHVFGRTDDDVLAESFDL